LKLYLRLEVGFGWVRCWTCPAKSESPFCRTPRFCSGTNN